MRNWALEVVGFVLAAATPTMAAVADKSGIYFNALALTPSGSGVQTYSRNVIAGVANKASTDVSARVQKSAVAELPANVTPDVIGDCAGAKRVFEGLRPVRSNPALIHGLDVDLPIARSTPTVATVHDLAVFDVPWAFSRFRAAGERALLRGNLKRADAIIAVSQFTADRLGELLGLDATVTHLAPNHNATPATPSEIASVIDKYGLPGRFVLHVGTVEPRKGIPALATACSQIGVPLVLAGAVQSDIPEVGVVKRLGYVPAEDLPSLFGAATVVAYPSVYEGFGLPPIEAIACGAIVVTTKVGALPEILGKAGYPLAEPENQTELAELLAASIRDESLRREMARIGLEATSALNWSRNAEQVLGVYSSLGVSA